MQKLFEHITTCRIAGTQYKFFERLAGTDLLILDDFGMHVLDSQQMLDFMEIMEDRHGIKATIIASQLAVSDWYDILSANTTAADAILDRLIHRSHRLKMKGPSMRKLKAENVKEIKEK